MCELFMSLILGTLIVAIVFFALVAIFSRKAGYQPSVQYDANTGKLKMRNPLGN